MLQLNCYAGRLERNYCLAKFTSWRVGGNAEWYFRPYDLADLVNFLQDVPTDMPVFFLGLGSNILFPDFGMPGVVIHSLKGLDSVQLYSADTIYAEAGTPCAKLAKFTIAHNCIGGEFFAGIPGTIGGALAMNAGAFGGTTWEHVVAVDVINRQGKIKPDAQSQKYRKPKEQLRLLQGAFFIKLARGLPEARHDRPGAEIRYCFLCYVHETLAKPPASH